MTDLIALAKQAGGSAYSFEYPSELAFTTIQLRIFADLIRKESEAERDRLREALEMLQKAMTEGHQEAYNNAIAACFEALEEAR